MQIIIDLPEQVVTEFYKRVPITEREGYLSSLLIKEFALNFNSATNSELSDNALKILEFAGCWSQENDEFSTEAIKSRRATSSRERYL